VIRPLHGRDRNRVRRGRGTNALRCEGRVKTRAIHDRTERVGIEIRGKPSLLAGPENFADIDPAELRADAVIGLRGEGGELERAVIFEVQLEWNDRKLYSWPAYVRRTGRVCVARCCSLSSRWVR